MIREAAAKHENPAFGEWSSRLHKLQTDVYEAVRESNKQGNLDARTDWLVQALRIQQEILASGLSAADQQTSMRIVHELIDGEMNSRNGAIGILLDNQE